MKLSLVSAFVTFNIVAVLNGIISVIEVKSFEHFIGGTVLLGSILAVSAFLMSLLSKFIASKKNGHIPSTAIAAVIIGLALGSLNIWSLSNDMTITSGVAMYQLAICTATSILIGCICLFCAKIST